MAFGPQYIGTNKNIGTNQSVKITRNDTGATVYLGGRLVSFKDTPNTIIDVDEGITDGGRPYHTRIPNGGTLDMTIERYNGDLDNFFKSLDVNFYGGQGQVDLTVTQTISNFFDNSTTVNTYTFCVPTQDSSPWTKAKGVMVTVKFHYTECL